MPDYRLLVEHKINRVRQPAGYEVSLSEQLGDWLVEQRIAEHVNGRAVVTRAPVVAPQVSKPMHQSISPRGSCCGKRPQ